MCLEQWVWTKSCQAQKRGKVKSGALKVWPGEMNWKKKKKHFGSLIKFSFKILKHMLKSRIDIIFSF